MFSRKLNKIKNGCSSDHGNNAQDEKSTASTGGNASSNVIKKSLGSV